MNRFEESNYYEILEVTVDASPFEIRRAYRNALELYNEDSLITHSLFSAEERVEIIKKITHAYTTLIDKAKRVEYDLMLRDKSTASDSEQDQNLPSTSYGKDRKNAIIGKESEDILASSRVARSGERGKATSTETHEKRSFICVDDVLKQYLQNKSVENKDFGLTRGLRNQVSFKMLVYVSVFALILIALAMILGPLILPGRYHLPFTRGDSHFGKKRSQAQVELTYVDSGNDKIKDEQERSANTALIETEPIASAEGNPVLD